MNAPLCRRVAGALTIALLLVAPMGCAVDGYGGTANVGVGLDYYEPGGFDYGGWGPGYGIGPYRDGGHRFDGRPDGRGHSFRAAPSSRGVPSIPSGARGGGGGRGGGGRR